MTESFPVRTITLERYPGVFAALVARSLEYEALVEGLRRWSRRRLRDGFTLLDVGAGTGSVWSAWFTGDVPRPGRIVAYEPAREHAESLVEAGASLGSVEVEVRDEPFDLEAAAGVSPFDLAVFSHSLYWIRRPAETLEAVRRRGRPGAGVVAVLQAPFAVHQLATLFEPRFERDRPVGADHRLSSHELLSGLRAAGVEDAEVEYLPGGFDLSDLHEPEASGSIDELLSFALQVEFAECPEAFRREVRDLLAAGCVRRADGMLFWNEPGAMVTLSAPADQG